MAASLNRKRAGVLQLWRWLVAALVLPAVACTCLAAGNDPPPPQKLLDDLKLVADLQKLSNRATATHQQLRNKAYQTAAEGVGLPKVQASFNTSKATVDRLTKELTKAAKESPEYARAVKEADAARAKLAELKDAAGLSDEERRRRTDELSRSMWAPADLIRKRLDDHSQLQTAKNTMADSQVEVTNLQRDVAGILSQDQPLAELAYKAKDAADKLAQAKRELAVSQKAYDDSRRKK